MKLVGVLRLVAVAHAVAVGLQPVLAGVYLNGSSSANRIHEPVGNVVALLCLTQLLVATIWWRTGGRFTAVLATAGILVAEALQIAMGYSRQLAVHIPLGIAILAATVAFTLWMFGPAPRSTAVAA